MHNPVIIFFLWALTAVFAYPLERIAATDIEVLAFANVLEQLESAFYTQALAHFNTSSFEMAGFASSQIPIQQIETIASDENTHAIALQSATQALGGQVVSNCTFNFSSAFTNVSTMVATARVVENVGVGAYLGALTSLSDPRLVMTAGSILTVEARHQTILNLLSNATSIPQPFDVALTPADVLAVADTFISGCKLGFSANPPLTVTNDGVLQAGMKLNLSFPALNETVSKHALSCKIVTGGMNASLYQPLDDCTVPANVTGPMYVFITNNRTQIAIKSPCNTSRTTNSSLIIAGPALLFVDQPDLIGSLIRPGLDAANTTAGNHTTPASPTSPPVVSKTTSGPMTGATSALLGPAQTSAASTRFIPSSGVFTTMLSPAQASSILSSLIG